MNYDLNKLSGKEEKASSFEALKKLLTLIAEERVNMYLALAFIIITSGFNLTAPFLIGYSIDHYVRTRQFDGIEHIAVMLIGMYLVVFVTGYLQTKIMGGVGQRLLFKLRNSVFNKLQELPVAFFNQNKAGDLISRVNNDTDKLNQFFSQALMNFIGTIFTMTGAGIFLLVINIRLGVAALLPGLLILVFTKIVSPWVKRKNADNLKSVGGMSGEIQESLNNFKVIIAFNRRDYFRKRFEEANRQNYSTAIGAGLANGVFLPVYGFFSSFAQLIVLTYGIYLIADGHFSIGLLISYLAYATNFYNPLRQLAALWTSFQVALAGWDRISKILYLDSSLEVIPASERKETTALLEFKNVHFSYPDSKEILHNISFSLEPGKTYALVGPTGGGKTTTASLMARLYDPTRGIILLDGQDIKSYSPAARTEKVGFILQEPFLFTGSVHDNIICGNEKYGEYSSAQLETVIRSANLEALVSLFENGLETEVLSGGDGISLGQKQLIAFMRAVLREPEILILDEASANIDTVTEQLLSEILKKLPVRTTKVIIAHRLNTIENADEIFFVNSGEVIKAGSLDHALSMLLNEKRGS